MLIELRFIQRSLNIYGAAFYQMRLQVWYKKKNSLSSTQLKKTLN